MPIVCKQKKKKKKRTIAKAFRILRICRATQPTGAKISFLFFSNLDDAHIHHLYLPVCLPPTVSSFSSILYHPYLHLLIQMILLFTKRNTDRFNIHFGAILIKNSKLIPKEKKKYIDTELHIRLKEKEEKKGCWPASTVWIRVFSLFSYWRSVLTLLHIEWVVRFFLLYFFVQTKRTRGQRHH